MPATILTIAEAGNAIIAISLAVVKPLFRNVFSNRSKTSLSWPSYSSRVTFGGNNRKRRRIPGLSQILQDDEDVEMQTTSNSSWKV